MPRVPDLPCADCGELMWRSTASLPEGQARCRPCRRKRPPVERTRPGPPCPACGVPMAAGAAGTHPCLECRKANGRSVGKGGQRRCEVCGADYRATYGEQRTCSRVCGVKINAYIQRATGRTRVSPVTWRQCSMCSGWYTAAGKRRCGCVLGYQKRGGGVVSIQCRDCAAPFDHVIVSNYPARCADCREAERKRRQRDGRKKRKALQRGVTVEPVSVAKVYERDRWCCGLCGRKVDKRLKYPHPKSASLDHVLPLSLGGAHSMANVQLAHLDCNLAKSNGGSQQLALVG